MHPNGFGRPDRETSAIIKSQLLNAGILWTLSMFRGEELPAHSTEGNDPGKSEIGITNVVLWQRTLIREIEDNNENATEEQIVKKERK